MESFSGPSLQRIFHESSDEAMQFISLGPYACSPARSLLYQSHILSPYAFLSEIRCVIFIEELLQRTRWTRTRVVLESPGEKGELESKFLGYNRDVKLTYQ
jgi:hypothetical protein